MTQKAEFGSHNSSLLAQWKTTSVFWVEGGVLLGHTKYDGMEMLLNALQP
jgi:hypothetical protein